MRDLVTGGDGFIGYKHGGRTRASRPERGRLDGPSIPARKTTGEIRQNTDYSSRASLKKLRSCGRSARSGEYGCTWALGPSWHARTRGPLDTNKLNIEGTLNVFFFVAAKEMKDQKLCVSPLSLSSSVYGFSKSASSSILKPKQCSRNQFALRVTNTLASCTAQTFGGCYGWKKRGASAIPYLWARQDPGSPYPG